MHYKPGRWVGQEKVFRGPGCPIGAVFTERWRPRKQKEDPELNNQGEFMTRLWCTVHQFRVMDRRRVAVHALMANRFWIADSGGTGKFFTEQSFCRKNLKSVSRDNATCSKEANYPGHGGPP